MAYNIIVQVTTQGAEKIDETTDKLETASAAADGTAAALGKMAAASAAAAQQTAAGMSEVAETAAAAKEVLAGIAAQREREAATLQRIKGPMDAYQADLRAAVALMEQGRLGLGEYEAELARLQDRLGQIERYSMTPQLRAEADLYDQITGPLRRYEQELAALNELLAKEQINLEQYDAALARVQQRAQASGAIAPTQGPAFDAGQAGLAGGPLMGPAFDPLEAGRGVSEELQRERALLEQLQAPLREYEAQLRTLDSLLKQDAISLEQYDAQLARAQKRAEGAGALTPVQGPKQQTTPAGAALAEEGSNLGGVLQAVAPQLGQSGMMLSQFASGGVMAAAGAAALALELGRLSDEYTTLANKVERFATDTQSADDILHQQLDLSRDLHSSLEATEELYVRVRESTYNLNLSQQQQLALAHDLGVEVAAEGRSAEEAAALMRRLGLAFETGTISGRELRAIFKQFPEVGQEIAEALGSTQAQLLQLANKGQLSAQQLIDAIHKVAPEAEQTLGRMTETYGQKFGHLWDSIKLSIGGALDALNQADEDQSKVVEQIYQRHLQTVRAAARQLDQELANNARTAQIAGAAKSVGIDVGPFDKEQADKITEVRMTARQAGVDIADAFEGARAKAQLYGAKVDEIKEQHAAKQIADDAKRIYDALYGVDDIMRTGFKRWQDMADQVTTITKAIERWKSLTPAGTPTSQEQRELELQLANVRTDQADAQYGKQMVTYAQGINNARAELEALSRAAKDGVISGEALRQKQDQLLTTLNDGRLPEAIKILEGLNLPVEQAARSYAALNALLRQGRIDVVDYTAELEKIAKVGHGNDATVLSDGIARLHQVFEEGLLTLRSYDAAVIKLVQDFGTLHTTAGGIQYRIAPQGASGPAGLLPGTEQPLALPSATSGSDIQGIMARYQATTGIVGGTDDAAKQLNEQLARANALADEFVAPSVKYEQRLKDIAGAQQLNAITEEEATAARRRAKDTLNQENEALAATKGPMEQYQAALRRLGDQLEDHAISAKQYADGVDKARTAMLEATGAAQTFQGALEIDWIKAKQGADSLGASTAKIFETDVGKFNDNVITALTGGGPEAQQARQALAQLQDQYKRGAITAADYATKYKELSAQLAASTNIWKNISTAFSSFVDSMIQDLERLAIKWLEMEAIKGILGLFGGGGSDAGGATASLPQNVDTLVGADAGLGGLDDLAGFANGGSYVVGGDGGTDSRLQAFWATPGERVTITPQGTGHDLSNLAAMVAAMIPPAPAVHIHNHYDSAVSQAALDGPGGQKSVMNTLRLNAGALRTLTSKPRRS